MLRTFFIRLGIILFCLAFIAQITAFLVFPDAVIEVAERIKGQERTIRVLLALLAVLADLVLLQVIYRELRFRRYQGDGLIARSREANVQVSLESVRDNVKTQVSRISDLYSVEVAVQPERGRVAMSLDITGAESINVRKKTSEIHREIVKVVERQMGLRLADRPVLRFNMAKNKSASVVIPPPPAPLPVAEARPKTGVFGRSKTEPTPPPPQPVYTPPPPPMRTPPPPPSRFPTPPPIIEAEHITPPEMPIMTTDEGEVFEVKTTKTDEEAAT